MITTKNCFQLGRALMAAGCLLSTGAFAQAGKGQVYDDFEGRRLIHYGERTGVLDTMVQNPAPNAVDNSAHCALYVRNSARKFANIKMNLTGKLTGVDKYATYEGIPPVLRLKVHTTAPVGTLVEILLGSHRGNNDYPAGTHSQYQAYTTKSNEWEELEFKFSQVPQGSETAADQVDQVVLLFNPNSATSDTYYFDDLTGPNLTGIQADNNDKNQSADAGDKKKTEKPAPKKASGK